MILTLNVPATDELYDEETGMFITWEGGILQLRHSLISISAWESKWKIPYLSKLHEKTEDQVYDYIKCMTVNDVDESIYSALTSENVDEIQRYIEDPMTATRLPKNKNKSPNAQIVTSETIYSWMITLQIPPEYAEWHLNRLLTLIEVCNINNAPVKKMSKEEIYAQNKQLNEQRKQQYNTRG